MRGGSKAAPGLRERGGWDFVAVGQAVLRAPSEPQTACTLEWAASLSLRPLCALSGSSALEQVFVFCPHEGSPHTEAARVHLRLDVNLNFEHKLDGLLFCSRRGSSFFSQSFARQMFWREG